MPLYFFDIRDEHGVIPDEEGITLEDRCAAEREAHASLRDLVKNRIDGSFPNTLAIEVRDRKGRILEISAVVKVETHVG